MLHRTALAVTFAALMFGCASGTDDTQEIVANLIQAGFPADDIMVVDGLVYVGRDAQVSLEASREMLISDPGKEQYRTTNLVSLSLATICVDGSRLTKEPFNTAVNNALANYNSLNLTFHMVRTSGNAAGCNALISIRISGPTGGSSGFPSGGLPFNSIHIGRGLSSFATSTVTHVITHELGHCVGFRHSDFFDRSISCGGQPSNEGDGGVGAILIASTPSGAVVGGSVMNSCFRTVEAGLFTSTDKTALNALY
ncbi:MAG: protease [Deltaproteobacteria bacterium]|nr:MAG: protease [Deltaproteobacteria bacterium]